MENAAVSSLPEHSQVVMFPPAIPATGFLLGVVLNWLVPLGSMVDGPLRTTLRVAGGAVFALGIAGFAWMIVTMKRARTPIHNARTPTTLVESGPFRFTRNPMYLFGSIWYAGLAIALVETWSLALLPLTVIALHYAVVLREEAYLSGQFSLPIVLGSPAEPVARTSSPSSCWSWRHTESASIHAS